MKKIFRHIGETMLRSLIAGLVEARGKWTVRYKRAIAEGNNKEMLECMLNINMIGDEIAAYSRMLSKCTKGGRS